MKNLLSFEDIIFNLQKFWQVQGCTLMQPIDLEVGAGTFHPATLLKSCFNFKQKSHFCWIYSIHKQLFRGVAACERENFPGACQHDDKQKIY